MNTVICLLVFVGLSFTDDIDPTIEPGPIIYTDALLMTKSGLIRGLVREANSTQVHFFQGIPYGKAEQFAKPAKADAWEGVYNATHVRFACPQEGMNYQPDFADWNETWTRTNVSSQDCLYLNVWKPISRIGDQKDLPVMVWIHGGGFNTGTIFDYMYDARYIAALGEVVVVSINYRLGALGFVVDPDTDEPSGNLGLYDMKLALEWVQDNIQCFGGDPTSITLFGESAGAMAIGALALSPLIPDGLFIRVILQSGAPNSDIGNANRTQSISKTHKLAEQLNCASPEIIECLKNRTIGEMINASQDIIFQPNYPEPFLPQSSRELLETFDRPIDLLFGTNSNEGKMLINTFKTNISEADNLATIKDKLVGLNMQVDNVTDLIQFYTNHLNENSSWQEIEQAVANVIGDYHIQCPTVMFGRQVINRHNYVEVHAHHYAYHLVQPLNAPVYGCTPSEGVCHSDDIIYVFGLPIHYANNNVTFDALNATICFNDNEHELSREIILTWTRFARSGIIGYIESTRWDQANSFASDVNRAGDICDMQLVAGNHTMAYSLERCNYLEKHILT